MVEIADRVEFQSTRPRGARRLIPGPASAAGRVSIHAPAWGATRQACRKERLARGSIHAPAWGATRSPCWPSPASGSFNPRARVGRDLKICMAPDRPRVFQSTRPRGARPDRWYGILRWTNGFNPRARVGRDLSNFPTFSHYVKFQSTRPRGARRFDTAQSAWEWIVSIHAPAWGATPLPARWPRGAARFNPRARVGRDCSSTPLSHG